MKSQNTNDILEGKMKKIININIGRLYSTVDNGIAPLNKRQTRLWIW